MYNHYYQLEEQPFRLTPDPRFLHMAEPHRAALEALLACVLLRKGFAVVSGPAGCGKTTLVHTLLELLAQHRITRTDCASALIVNPTVTRDEFFELLLDEYEIKCNSTNKSQRILALERMFREVDSRGGTCVLCIDEAHLLSIELLEEIRLLSNVDSHKGKLLQVILSGQTELFELLNKPETRALKQRIATRCHLRSLSLAETRVYVAERLHAAGLSGPNPFSAAALEAVHRFAEGVPRLINLVCDESLSIGFQTQRSKIEPGMVHDAAVALDLAVGDNVTTPVVGQDKSLVPTMNVMITSMKEWLMHARMQGSTPDDARHVQIPSGHDSNSSSRANLDWPETFITRK
jgi:general secretion pathway protein A